MVVVIIMVVVVIIVVVIISVVVFITVVVFIIIVVVVVVALLLSLERNEDFFSEKNICLDNLFWNRVASFIQSRVVIELGHRTWATNRPF